MSKTYNHNRIIHRGYYGSIEPQEDGTYYGKILNIGNDLVTYESDDVDGLTKEFVLAIEDYEKTCKELGRKIKKKKIDMRK